MIDDKYIRALASQTDFQGSLLEGLIDPDNRIAFRQRTEIAAALVDVCIAAIKMLTPSAVIEVGSNEGSFSLAMKAALPSSRVVAFEAHPEIYAKYQSKLGKHGIEAVPLCVADVTGSRMLHVPLRKGRQRRSMGSILRHAEAQAFSTYEVPATTLDAFFAVDPPASCALWIDVEGAIDAVIEGSPITLDGCLALYVELESTERWAGQKLASEMILKLGRHGLLPAFRDVQRPGWQYNLLFLRAGALDAEQLDLLSSDYARRCCSAVLPPVRRTAEAQDSLPAEIEADSPATQARSRSGLNFWRWKKADRP